MTQESNCMKLNQYDGYLGFSTPPNPSLSPVLLIMKSIESF